MKTGWFVIAVTLGVALAQPAAEPAAAQVERPGVEMLYILDCGQGRAADQSRWSPGVNVDVPLDMGDTCYSHGL